jgi:peptidyl-prolyl cis-trans isomerase A (cyclophilin A)
VDLALGKKPWRATEEGAKVRRPLYNGTIFHRVIPEFMIQGGDPLGNGMGGPGYDFPDENLESSIFDGPGKLAMANRGPDTNGSQFFITEVALPHLNGTSQIFGDCQNGEVVQRIARVERVMDRPVVPVVLERVVITGR